MGSHSSVDSTYGDFSKKYKPTTTTTDDSSTKMTINEKLIKTYDKLDHRPKKSITWRNKDEARHAFKNMLCEKSVSWEASWEQALKYIINDFRYNHAIKTISERKTLFVQWSKQQEKYEWEKTCAERKHNSQNFLQLLEETGKHKIIDKYSVAEKLLEKEKRWIALASRR